MSHLDPERRIRLAAQGKCRCGRERDGDLRTCAYCRKRDFERRKPSRRGGQPAQPEQRRVWGAPHTLEYDTVEARGPLPTPCRLWRWNKARKPTGVYGHSREGRKTEPAHRLFYRLFKGPIPAGHEIDHLCRITLCVNPDHLEAVSHTENVYRGKQCKLARGEAFVLRQYLKLCVERGRPAPGKALSAAFNVSDQALSAIRRRKSWADITLAGLIADAQRREER